MDRYSGDALHTDLYQIWGMFTLTMGYMKENHILIYISEKPHLMVVMQFLAGLEKVIDYIRNFKFTEDDINYLRSLDYSEQYLKYLSDLKFTGSIRSVVEGEIVFGNEPLL